MIQAIVSVRTGTGNSGQRISRPRLVRRSHFLPYRFAGLCGRGLLCEYRHPLHQEPLGLMTSKRDKSRQQWEAEIEARQQNITPADYPEGLHYVRADGLPRISPQWRFWLGIVLITIGLSMFRSAMPVSAAILVAAAGLFLSVTAMHLKN